MESPERRVSRQASLHFKWVVWKTEHLRLSVDL